MDIKGKNIREKMQQIWERDTRKKYQKIISFIKEKYKIDMLKEKQNISRGKDNNRKNYKNQEK